MPIFSGSGVQPSLKGLPSNVQELQAGQVWLIQPAGWYMIALGKYTVLQQLDPIMNAWRTVGGHGAGQSGMEYIYADGVNYRLANQSGCAVGGLMTNHGTAYTSAPTVTTTTGGSIWRAVMGEVVSSVSVGNGGSGYTYPPTVQIAAPPQGGIQATAYCTLTTGAVSSVTMVDVGGGYVSPPQLTFVNDPREGVNGIASGTGAAATAVVSGSGTVNGLVCLDHGSPITAIPTFVFAGGGGSGLAATVIMNWAITAYAVTTAGDTFSGATAWITGEDAFPTAAAAYANPTTQSGLVRTRKADIKGVTSGAGLTATGQVVYDGGCYSSAPTPVIAAFPAASPTTASLITFTVGGQNDINYLTPL